MRYNDFYFGNYFCLHPALTFLPMAHANCKAIFMHRNANLEQYLLMRTQIWVIQHPLLVNYWYAAFRIFKWAHMQNIFPGGLRFSTKRWCVFTNSAQQKVRKHKSNSNFYATAFYVERLALYDSLQFVLIKSH